jgi:septum formation protein
MTTSIDKNRPVILGSTSVYRRELMNRLRIPFDVQAPDVDETARKEESPLALAQRLALAKAHAVAQKSPESVVIGSDQVADLNGLALGKPGNFERATLQLRLMRGKTVVFHTAVAVICHATGFVAQDCASVHVVFRDLSDAGSAKSEGLGIALLSSIDSDDPTALVGLPLIRTCNMLRAAGVKLL